MKRPHDAGLIKNEKTLPFSLVPSFNDGLADAPAAGVKRCALYFGGA